jgi:hypothetical protein
MNDQSSFLAKQLFDLESPSYLYRIDGKVTSTSSEDQNYMSINSTEACYQSAGFISTQGIQTDQMAS